MSLVAQALVFQEFEAAPTAVVDTQRACIIGPRKSLLRYNVAAEKEGGNLGDYVSTLATPYAWPSRAAGDVVIPASVRLFIEDALLQYFHNAAGSGDTIRATRNSTALQALVLGDSSGANVIRAAATTWQATTGYAVDADLPTPVAVGDGIKVSAVVDGEVVSAVTRVTGFLPDVVASAVGSAREDAANLSARAEDSSSASPGVIETETGAVAATDIQVDPSVTPGGAHVYTQGLGADTYVLEVVSGGAYNEAVFSLVSASGTDNQADIVLAGSLGDSEPIGAKGLAVAFAWLTSGSLVFVTGQQWTLDVVFQVADTDVSASGTYTGAQDTTYIATVSRGGVFGETTPQITISTTTGYDFSGPHEVVSSGASVAIGSYGVTLTFTGTGLAAGDRFYVTVTAAKAGALRTLVLQDSLPDALTDLITGVPPALSVTLYVRKNMEITRERVGYAPLVNFVVGDTQLTVNSGIIGYDLRVTGDTGLVPLPVRAGTLYVEYAAYVADGVGVVSSVASVGELSPLANVRNALGTVTPDNPLAYGVYKALANTAGGTVAYVQTAGDTLADYLAALDILSNRNDVYSLVPMTFDRDVQDAVAAHVVNMSGADVGRWRICFVSRPAIESEAIVASVDGAAVLATISVGATPRLVCTSAGVHFTNSGVRAGDWVRAVYTADGFGATRYEAFRVDAVVSPTELRLFSGPSAAVTEPAKFEVWRVYGASDVAALTGANAGSFGHRRVVCVWPDYAQVAGEDVPGYFLAAAIAGLKSSVLPQQSLTNVEVSGFDGVPRATRLFSSTQLNTLAAAGVLVVTQSPTGQIYVRMALTTDNSDINHAQLMRTTNLDSISYVMLAAVAGYQGRYNITPKLAEMVRLAVVTGIETLGITTASESIGPQVLGLLSPVTVVQHPVLRDRLVLRAALDLPYPNNNSELHLVI